MADQGGLGVVPGAAHAPEPEPAGLAARVERILAVEPEESALRRLVSALVDAVPEADAAALVLDQGGALEVAAAVGLEPAEDEAAPEPAGLAAQVIAAGAPAAASAPGAPLPAGTRGALGVPLRSGERRGALLLGSRARDALGEEALALLRVAADRCGRALQQGEAEREQRRAGEQARRAALELESRRKAVDFILGVVGHDLRNPLGAVHMSAALLQKRGALEGWQARAVERMRSSAGRMGRIIADLLSYTRTRLGNGLPVQPRPAQLDDLARRVVEELQAANPDRTLALEVEGDVRGEWDPDRLEQVVSNLVANAIDHGDPSTPVQVRLRGEPGHVILGVRNEGSAVPPEVLARLFEPFSRPPEEKSRKGSGLGLGLYIAREIVTRHGGEIGVASEDGFTEVTVRLPRGTPASQ
ncbi:MAG: ATP-binding protein [Anaeromyxobacter sp.]